MLCVILCSQSGSSAWPRTGAITGLGAADPLQSNNGNSITNRFERAGFLLQLPAAECSGDSTDSSQQTVASPADDRSLTTGGRGADTGLTAAQHLGALEPRKQRVVGSIPGRQSLDFSLFERRFEAAQPEMTVPVGQTPPASNPPL